MAKSRKKPKNMDKPILIFSTLGSLFFVIVIKIYIELSPGWCYDKGCELGEYYKFIFPLSSMLWWFLLSAVIIFFSLKYLLPFIREKASN